MTLGMRRLWRIVSLALGLGLAALTPTGAHAQQAGEAFSGTCPNGAPAREERYCRFIIHYDNSDHPLPTEVGDFLGVTNSSDTRTIGFVIAIDKYPGLPGHDISAAAVDAANLQAFLMSQQFDEIIMLRNADASVDNINYFLTDYLVNHGNDYRGPDGQQPKARLLIAYSGHGRAQTPDVDAAFILNTATDPNGSSGVYKMTDFTGNVSHLASHYFHVLTLVNACFGGNLFVNGNPGAAATPTGQGSFMITAGSPKNEVQALIPSRGSLFFDLVINGVLNGDADKTSASYYLTDGSTTTKSREILTLSLPLYNYLSGAFFKINTVQKHSDPGFRALSPPFFGPVQSGMAQGSFFFVSTAPEKLADSMGPYLKPLGPGAVVEMASIPSNGVFDHLTHAASAHMADPVLTSAPAITHTEAAVVAAPPPPPPAQPATRQLPFGPISSIKGHPDIKIFKLPAIYPIKGYDFSSADGKIDWGKFKAGALPRFVYLRAQGWAGRDTRFAANWASSAAIPVDRGVYLKFNFCQTVAEQIGQLRQLAPPGASLLPVGIELVTPSADQARGAEQLVCYQKLGTTNVAALAEAQKRILDLASAVETQWGKVPILIGNSYNLSVLTDARSDHYMIWLDAYGDPAKIGERMKLQGRNPWTMWQYSGTLDVAGVGSKTTGEVFFGTPAQYDAFRSGSHNVALKAVQ